MLRAGSAFTFENAHNMNMEQKTIAFIDHVREQSGIPTTGCAVTFDDGVNMGAWWQHLRQMHKKKGTPPDRRLLALSAIRQSWEVFQATSRMPGKSIIQHDRRTHRMTLSDRICAFRDHVKRTGEVPNRSRRGHTPTFIDGVVMGTWWAAHMRKCRRIGTAPHQELLSIPTLRSHWERVVQRRTASYCKL